MARGFPMLAPSGYVAAVQGTACSACGECARACPFGALEVTDAPAVIRDKCMGCGICAARAPRRS